MLYMLLKTLHLLAVIGWLGGMAFALFCLRPAVAPLPAPQRVQVMALALGRFLNAALAAGLVILASGGWMFGRVAKTTRQTGLPFNPPLEWLVMAGLGVLMLLILGHVRFALLKRLRRAQAAEDWPAAGRALDAIRGWVAVNLTIGVVIVVAVFSGTVS
jgi:uncharacterized membrane protein